MSPPTVRGALQLLPPLGTTGIGSLPHSQLELGLQMALQVDIPYAPQLPTGNPGELMIASALDGLPGLRFDGEGMCTVDLAAWQEGREAFGARLEQAISSGELASFEPSPQACRAWRPFLWEVENRKLALAKAQLAGPATVRWVARTSAGGSAAELAQLDQQIFRLLLAKALAMVKALRRAGATPLLFLDEPGLYALDRHNPRHLVVLQELRVLIMALQREGALVGLHCCSNTLWGSVLELGLDLVSLDVRLSLDAVLDDREAFARFLATGATLSLGIIPTDLASTYAVDELVDAVESTFSAALGPKRGRQALQHVLLTPACGLALRSVVDAERLFDEVKRAQRQLQALAEEGAAVPAAPPAPLPAPN